MNSWRLGIRSHHTHEYSLLTTDTHSFCTRYTTLSNLGSRNRVLLDQEIVYEDDESIITNIEDPFSCNSFTKNQQVAETRTAASDHDSKRKCEKDLSHLTHFQSIRRHFNPPTWKSFFHRVPRWQGKIHIIDNFKPFFINSEEISPLAMRSHLTLHPFSQADGSPDPFTVRFQQKILEPLCER